MKLNYVCVCVCVCVRVCVKNVNAWEKTEKIFCVTIIWRQNHSKLQAKFRRKFNFNNYPQKSQMYRWVHKFQATGSVSNLIMKVENPCSGRKLIPKCPDNVDVMRDSVGRSVKRFL